jgi:hypothetical protein
LVQDYQAKYNDANNLFSSSSKGGSQFWKSLDKIKHYFKLGAKHSVGDRRRTCFWLDWWSGDAPFKDTFPYMFAICENPSQSLTSACAQNGLHIRFHRSLGQEGMAQWTQLCNHLAGFSTSDDLDRVSWHLNASDLYSVQSIYEKCPKGRQLLIIRMFGTPRFL